jgi:8-demethyl-8-alpha-L-rhamnosyltetracenomycin-C 2'-O-methyltransferase
MTPLCELALKYGTNKCEEGYTPFYYAMFSLPRFKVKKVLELGIGGPGKSGGPSKLGASLYMWEEFFPEAEITGVDNDPALLINAGRIRSFQADVFDPMTLTAVALNRGPFDVIIDDAVHLPEPQLSSALTLLPYLSPTGVYIIEDVANCPPEEIMVALPPEYRSATLKCAHWPIIIIARR